MEVEQRGDDLEVVLHPVMDLADQPRLADDRRLEIGLVAGDGPGHPVEGLARARRSPAPGCCTAGRSSAAVAGLVGGDDVLDPAERPQQQPLDDDPADHRRPEPHQHRGQDDEDLAEAHRRRRQADAQRILVVGEAGSRPRPRGRAPPRRHARAAASPGRPGPARARNRPAARACRPRAASVVAAIFGDALDRAGRIVEEDFEQVAARQDDGAADLAARGAARAAARSPASGSAAPGPSP